MSKRRIVVENKILAFAMHVSTCMCWEIHCFFSIHRRCVQFLRVNPAAHSRCYTFLKCQQQIHRDEWIDRWGESSNRRERGAESLFFSFFQIKPKTPKLPATNTERVCVPGPSTKTAALLPTIVCVRHNIGHTHLLVLNSKHSVCESNQY